MTTLEQIREEIKQKRDNVPIESDVQQAIACGLDLALQIVEKYAKQEPESPCDLCRYDYLDGYCGDCPAMANIRKENK